MNWSLAFRLWSGGGVGVARDNKYPDDSFVTKGRKKHSPYFPSYSSAKKHFTPTRPPLPMLHIGCTQIRGQRSFFFFLATFQNESSTRILHRILTRLGHNNHWPPPLMLCDHDPNLTFDLLDMAKMWFHDIFFTCHKPCGKHKWVSGY